MVKMRTGHKTLTRSERLCQPETRGNRKQEVKGEAGGRYVHVHIAVGYYGYPRNTADMDIWVALNPANARKLVSVFQEFGMEDSSVIPSLFLQPGKYAVR